jgi:hypothetical protein
MANQNQNQKQKPPPPPPPCFASAANPAAAVGMSGNTAAMEQQTVNYPVLMPSPCKPKLDLKALYDATASNTFANASIASTTGLAISNLMPDAPIHAHQAYARSNEHPALQRQRSEQLALQKQQQMQLQLHRQQQMKMHMLQRGSSMPNSQPRSNPSQLCLYAKQPQASLGIHSGMGGMGIGAVINPFDSM